MRGATLLAALAAIVMAGPATKQAAAGPGCCKAKMSKMVAGAMERMPHMTYQVGDFKTGCQKTAASKACAKNKVQFVVGEKVYDSETEAVTALADSLEKEMGQMSKVVFAVGKDTYCCPMTAGQMAKKSGTKMAYRVAGIDFDSKEKADKAAKLVAAVASSDLPPGHPPLAGDLPPGHPPMAGDKPDCSKKCNKGAKTASGEAKPDCSKKCNKGAKTAAGEAKPDCSKKCNKGAKTAAGEAKPDCSKKCNKGAKTASGEAKPACCEKAQERLVSVQAKIRMMVETAATAL